MSGVPAQDYATGKRGQRYPIHTPRLRGNCRCNGCHQHRYWTPERRAARGEQVRLRWANGGQVLRRNPNERRAVRWWPREDEALRSLAGQYDCLTIAAMLTERFGKPRTESAVEHRLKHLGIFRLDVRPLSSSEVGRIFGITRETVRVRFVLSDLMPGTLRRGGPHGMRMWTRAELEQLIREHPEAYDAEAIRDPSLASLALAVRRGREPLGTADVERLTGIDGRTLAGWYAAGRVPSARKVRGCRPGAGGAWLIDRADLETVRAIPAAIRSEQRARADARRDPVTGRLSA